MGVHSAHAPDSRGQDAHQDREAPEEARARQDEGERHPRAASSVRVQVEQAHLRSGDRRRVADALAHATTLQSAVISQIEGNTMTIAAGETVGKEIAKQCLEKGIEKVCFDRAGYIYHGRIKAVAEGAREGGLDF